MKEKIILLLATSVLSILALELILRRLEPPAHDEISPEAFFSIRSSELGWDGKPNAEGYFADGLCHGHVVNDRYGNRMNSAEGTFRDDYRSVLLIGDSNTAALEVDNDETVAALLEQELRRRGMRVNVINFGVRGYGTDQSVRKALLYAQKIRPEQIIYMYTDNDFFDNNIIRLVRGHYGKGVYLRRGSNDFTAHNYPVPTYESGFWGAVLIDDEGEPFLHTGTQPQKQTAEASPAGHLGLGSKLEQSLLVYRAIADFKRAIFPDSLSERKRRFWKHRREDPWAVMRSDHRDSHDVLFALFFATIDGGVGRIRHREYYEAQFKHLIGMLRDIPSLQQVHLVEFPSVATLELVKRNQPSTNHQLFENLVGESLVDTYVNLNEALSDDQLDLEDLECKRGDHFGAAGNRWVAQILMERVSFAGSLNDNDGFSGVQ